MDRQPVTSSMISSVGYDAESKILEVEFKGGAVYRYDGVSPETYRALMDAESIGKQFTATIKGQYPSVKL